jgi:hypothetical protein
MTAMSHLTATSPVQIIAPKNGYTKKNKGGLVVLGKADESIAAVIGECQSIPPSGPPIKGKQFVFTWVPGGTPGSSFYRWVLAFIIPPNPDPNNAVKYQLTVTGLDQNFQPVLPSDSLEFKVKVDPKVKVILEEKQLATHTGLSPDIVTITDPDASGLIADPSDFEPSGDLFDYELDVVTLTDATGDTVTVLSKVSDPWTYNFWWAQFDTVPSPGTYDLHVQDASGPNSAQDLTCYA